MAPIAWAVTTGVGGVLIFPGDPKKFRFGMLRVHEYTPGFGNKDAGNLEKKRPSFGQPTVPDALADGDIIGPACEKRVRLDSLESGIGTVMDKVGLKKGGFYRHFKSKDDLFVESGIRAAMGEASSFWSRQRRRTRPGPLWKRCRSRREICWITSTSHSDP